MMSAMRTTVMLDDDLAGLLKQRARELGIPFREAVNRTIRAGFGEAAALGAGPPRRQFPILRISARRRRG